MPQDQVKIKKDSTKGSVLSSSDGNRYPWGTELRFEGEMIEELGIQSLDVGDIVEVRGFAFVESKSEHKNIDDSDKSISFQMTTIKMQRETSDRAEELYGPNS